MKSHRSFARCVRRLESPSYLNHHHTYTAADAHPPPHPARAVMSPKLTHVNVHANTRQALMVVNSVVTFTDPLDRLPIENFQKITGAQDDFYDKSTAGTAVDAIDADATEAFGATVASDAAAAAKGLNDNAHGIDRFGYRVRYTSSPLASLQLHPSNPLRHRATLASQPRPNESCD